MASNKNGMDRMCQEDIEHLIHFKSAKGRWNEKNAQKCQQWNWKVTDSVCEWGDSPF